MGAEHHDLQDAPAHRLTVEASVTNAQSGAFVQTIGHVTFCKPVPTAAQHPARLREC